MAIVIKTDTNLFSPVYNKMEVAIFQNGLTISSPDYRYIFDINIVLPDGTTETIRTKVSPDPTQQFGVQDLSGHIEKYVKEEIVPNNDTKSFRRTDNGIVKYYVEYGEEYRLTINDPIVEYPNQLTGSNKYAFGGSFEWHRWIDFTNNAEYLNYLFDTNNQGEFLTNYKTPKVTINDLGWHWFLTETPTQVDYMEVKTYNSLGGLISTFQIDKTITGSDDQDRLQSIPTAPQSLNNVTDPFILGSQPVITSAVSSYTIQCFESGGTNVGEMLTFTIQQQCFYEIYRIHFENEYGAFDSFNFTKNSKRSSEGERKSFTTNKPNLDSSGINYYHSEEKKVDYYGKFSNKVNLVSDFLTETENNWLKEMVFSNKAYLEFETSQGVRDFKPCKILSTSWSEKKTAIDKLFILEAEIELTDNFRQRR